MTMNRKRAIVTEITEKRIEVAFFISNLSDVAGTREGRRKEKTPKERTA